MKFFTHTIPILSILLIAGCVGETATTGSSTFGVVVNTFAPDFAELESNDRFTLTLETTNNGGSVAKDVYAFLHGITLGTTPESFRNLTDSSLVFLSRSLDPPDEASALPGEIADATWDLRAPILPQGVAYSYQPRVRVFYRYETRASSSLTIMSTDEFKRLQTRADALPSQTSTLVSKGPLGVQISANAPVVVRADSDTFRVLITLTSVGTGTVFNASYDYATNSNVPSEIIDNAQLIVSAPGLKGSDCVAFSEDGTKSDTVRLRGGSTATYSCTLQITNVPTRVDIPINVRVVYGYFQDAVTTLTVRGT